MGDNLFGVKRVEASDLEKALNELVDQDLAIHSIITPVQGEVHIVYVNPKAISLALENDKNN